MAYSNLFNSRMNAKGNSSYERKMNYKSRSFKHWFDNTLNREWVTIDDIGQYAVIQDQNQNNNKDLSDDKYVIVEKTSNLQVGSIVDYRDKEWIVFTDEIKTIPTHIQAKVKESNGHLKWLIDGKVCNNGEGYPAYLQNQTLYTLGVATSGSNIWIVNAKFMVYMPFNEETKNIKIGQRLIVGGAVYQVMFKDYVSRAGLINYLLEEDFYNPEIDNMELEVANYYGSVIEESTDSSEETTIEKEVLIEGSDKARIGATVTYTATIKENGIAVSEDIVEWTVADTESVATVTEQTTSSITLKIVSNFQKVGSTINIIGKTSDGTIGSKLIYIISPY